MRISLPTPETILKAGQAIRDGKLVIMPTETVYGLAADASNPGAVRQVFVAKGRPSDNPLIVHVASIDQAKLAVKNWPELATSLAEAFWPGPLSMILPKSDLVGSETTAGQQSVAVRFPSHPVARSLIEASGKLIAAPSANRFMRLSATKVEDLDPEIIGAAEIVLDGGICEFGIESTVISLLGHAPQILRPGAISRAQIEEVLSAKIDIYQVAPGDHSSPGQYRRHYAPDVPTTIVAKASSPWALLYRSDQEGASQLVMPLDPIGYSASLYASLHTLERLGATEIEIESPPLGTEWEAVWDRLTKATSTT